MSRNSFEMKPGRFAIYIDLDIIEKFSCNTLTRNDCKSFKSGLGRETFITKTVDLSPSIVVLPLTHVFRTAHFTEDRALSTRRGTQSS